MVSQRAFEEAVRAFDTRTDAPVLDLDEDSDLEGARLLRGPRRLRFRRGELVVDALVHDNGGADGFQLLVRLTPRSRFAVQAVTRGRDLTVEAGVTGRADSGGIARLTGLPHGMTSLQVMGSPGRPRVRTAWVRL